MFSFDVTDIVEEFVNKKQSKEQVLEKIRNLIREEIKNNIPNLTAVINALVYTSSNIQLDTEHFLYKSNFLLTIAKISIPVSSIVPKKDSASTYYSCQLF